MRIPWQVSSYSSLSYPTKILVRGAAITCPSKVMAQPVTAIITRLFLKRLPSSSLFPAP